MKKLIALSVIIVAFSFVLFQGAKASNAAGVCVPTAISTSATTVLPANDLGSTGRKVLLMQNITSPTSGAASTIWCQIGAAAAANAGIALSGAVTTSSGTVTAAPVFQFPASQQPAKTFPIVPSGQVSCWGSAASLTVLVCDY